MRKLIFALAAAAAACAAPVVLAPGLAMAAPAAPADASVPRAPTVPGQRAWAASLRAALPAQCLGSSSQQDHAVPWAQQQLAPQRVWDMTTGAGQVVAVVDSGVSGTAPALPGAVLPGRDILTGHAGNSDCLGHGTFAAGLIAARPEPGTGFEGLAPQAQILPVDVVDPAQAQSLQPVTSSSAVAAGIRFAVGHGATVVDVSTATTPSPSAALRAAVTYAAARNVVVIAPVSVSSGASPANTVSYPADYPGVIAVSAVDSGDAPVAAATSGVRVDLAAPGAGLTSIGPSGPGEITGDGSALATAFVAGTAALVRSHYPRLSAAQIVHRLEATADQPGTALPDPQVGYGIVDPYTAVTTALPEESGGAAPAAPPARVPHLPPLRAPGTWPVIAALIVCGVLVVGIAAGSGMAHIVRNGRRRGWRPPPGRSSWHKRAPGPPQLPQGSGPPQLP